MAIIKQAKNIYVNINKTDTSYSGSFEIIAKEIFIYSTEENLKLNSNKKITANGDSNMHFTGKLKEGIAAITKTYWSSDESGESMITQSNLENTVYFHIKTVGLSNQSLSLQLFDRNALSFKDDKLFEGKTIEKKCQLDKDGYGKIELELPLDWTKDLEDEKVFGIINTAYRRIYWKVVSGHKNVKNKKIETFLRVHRSDRFLHVESSDKYNLPQIYTTEGEQITVFAEYLKEEAINKVKEEVIDFVSTAVEESVREGAHRYAVGKLSKGYLVTQSREIIGGPKNARGKNRQMQLIYYDVEGKPFYHLRANDINYKNFKGERISTKGVDPYQVFFDQKSGCKLRILGYFDKVRMVYDIFQVLKQVMENKPGERLHVPLLKRGPAMFFDLVGMMAYHEFSKIDDSMEAFRRERLEEAKTEGLEAVMDLLKSWKWWNGVGRVNGAELKDHQIEYELLDITCETAMKIKQGEFKTYKDMYDYNSQNVYDDNKDDVTILIRNQNDPVRKGRVDIIETFFIKEQL